MAAFSVELFGLRIFISCIGIVGNLILIFSVFPSKLSRMKSFELFLLGLAVSNLGEILVVDTYDIIMLKASSAPTSWSCLLLKFLTALGEICSILFTVLICMYRYQKLKDAHKRVNLPVFLDSMRSALIMSAFCVLLGILLSAPIYVIEVRNVVDNFTLQDNCPLDFFACEQNHCPDLNRLYKYLFLLFCNLLPLLIVTVTSCLILTTLMSRRNTVTPVQSVSGSSQFIKKNKSIRNRSTIAVLAAMALFQIDWSLYLIFHLTISTDVLLWAEMEYFVSTSYTSISPYVYGIGNNMFSFKRCMKN